MQRTVDQLEIHHDSIDGFHGGKKNVPLGKACGFDRQMNAVQRRRGLEQKVRLHERLSARKRYAAAHLRIERRVAKQLGCERIGRERFSAERARAHRTDGDAATAGRADGGSADGGAGAAADAGAPAYKQLGLHGEPLRIVTPVAAQRAALEKHGLANAGAVVYGKFFDVENDALIHNSIPVQSDKTHAKRKENSLSSRIIECGSGKVHVQFLTVSSISPPGLTRIFWNAIIE